MSLADERPDAAEGFSHQALLYSGRQEFLAGTLPFVAEGLRAGDAVIVALPPHRLDLLRDALGRSGTAVEFVDMSTLGRNPARILTAWCEFVAAHGGSGHVRGITEPVWTGRSDEELSECHRHEQLLNVACAGAAGSRLLCPYDAGRLGPAVIGEAYRSHPWVSRLDRCAPSPAFSDAVAAVLATPLTPPPESAISLPFGADTVRAVRELAAEMAGRAGLDTEAVDDLVLAVHEIATNSVRHGGGGGVMRGWLTATGVTCQVEDSGRIDDPLAGRLPPPPEGVRGRGLWLANRLCDLVQIRSTAAGTVVRLQMNRG